MELLRILAMVIIMLVHANFRALGYPTSSELADSPLGTFMRFLCEGFCIMGVNVFVMLSGWYGIRFKPVRLLELLFQILFFVIVVTAVDCLLQHRTPSLEDVGFLFLKRNYDYWFIKAYLMLYILSPVVNAFVDKADKKQFQVVLLCFFAFTFLWGWLLNGAEWIKHGHSGIFFIGVYLLARYIRLYGGKLKEKKISFYLAVYVLMALLIACIAYILLLYGKQGAIRKVYYYTCPLVILQAIAFLLIFTKISIKSKIINWTALSTLAIYLVHSSRLLGESLYDEPIADWYATEGTGVFLVKTLLLVIATFWAAIFLDKIRIFVWNTLLNRFKVNYPKQQ